MWAAGGASFVTVKYENQAEAVKPEVSHEIDAVITNGKTLDNLYKILDGENARTLFVGKD